MRVCWLRAWVSAVAPLLVGFGADASGQPANDLCEDCMVIDPADLPLFFSGVAHDTATDDIDVSCNDPASPVTRFGLWYCITPTEDCTLDLSAGGCGGRVVSIFTGPDCATLTEVACGAGVLFDATAGVNYRVLIGLWSSSTTPPACDMQIEFHCANPVPFPFFEDFESGGQGWLGTGWPYVLWHIAEDGECLAQTRMAAYNNGPAACDYITGTTPEGRFKSPPFIMTDDPPFTLSFRYIRQMDPSVDTACVWIVGLGTQGTDAIGCVWDNSGQLLDVVMDIPNSPFWAGQQARIEFSFMADQIDNDNPGFFVDEVLVEGTPPVPPIPTVSEWGIVVMVLLLVTGGTVVFGRRRVRARVRGKVRAGVRAT